MIYMIKYKSKINFLFWGKKGKYNITDKLCYTIVKMNFIQKAENQNKIKNLSQINCDYYENIVEYLQNNLLEEKVQYNNYSIGDIVFVQKYKYRSGKIGNSHMFVIVDFKEQAGILLYFGMLISSKIEKLVYKSNKLLQKDNQNNLKKNSIIKTDAIYKIFTKNILLKIGNIDKTKVENYKKNLLNSN